MSRCAVHLLLLLVWPGTVGAQDAYLDMFTAQNQAAVQYAGTVAVNSALRNLGKDSADAPRATADAGAALRLRRDPAITQRVRQLITDDMRTIDPKSAAAFEKTSQGKDFAAGFRHTMRAYGLSSDDVADVLTAYVVLGWMVVHQRPEPPDATWQAVRRQMRERLAASPIARWNDAQQQRLADWLIFRTLRMTALWATLRNRPDAKKDYAAFASAVRSGMRHMLGRDIAAVRLTARGLE